MSVVANSPPDFSKMTLEQVFEEYKKLPDWNRWPLPEVFYKTFDVKKPQPQSVQEITSFNSMNYIYFGEKAHETRGPAEGGVREIKEYMTLPVEVKMITDEEAKAQTDGDTIQYSKTDSSNLPIEDNTKETQPE